jgi:HAD superfamily hydrolase (TIGR01490 family)
VSTSSQGTALFDLDRTLLDCNSGSLWVSHEWRAGRITFRDVVWASYWLARYGLGHSSGLDRVMEAAAVSVTGLPEAMLDERVTTWFEREVRHRLRKGARQALVQHRERGDRLVLATSGTSFAAVAAAKAFQLDDVIATRLQCVDGTLTGKVDTMCVGEGKARAVEDWARVQGLDLAHATFYTDSASDLALLERVGHPVVVCPDRALRKIAATRGWPVVDWGNHND